MQRRIVLIQVCLALITFGVFSPALRNEFVNYDDTIYITRNPHVQTGLTKANAAWAFNTFYSGNWHPLTWLSHMVDVELYGLNPAGHHLTNILFHIANTLLLFGVLRRMTGATWRSALVAALFAWHPLRVESVAWASERKDVLSTFFWLLTMVAYVGYVERARVSAPGAKLRYALAILAFAVGLMAKGMLVTLPFVLLLLDYWPLNRIAGKKSAGDELEKGEMAPLARVPLRRLIIEKLPFFALAGLACLMTFVAQRSSGNVWSGNFLPLSLRATTALVAYLRYMENLVWPTHLCVLYPLMASWPRRLMLASAVMLVAVSVNVFRMRSSKPYLVTGWLWFLGTLVPVIGLVQVGFQSMADRYTYVPMIGLAILVVWGGADLIANLPARKWIAGLAGEVALCGCLVMTWAQLQYWKNTEALFRRALAVTVDNHMARSGLGLALRDQGRIDEAIEQYQAALRITPKFQMAQVGLGSCYMAKQQWQEAADQFSKAIKVNTRSAEAHTKLGVVLTRLGKSEEAAHEFEMAIQFERDGSLAMNELAWLRATDPDAKLRNGKEAVELAERAQALSADREAQMLGVLDAAYAEAGRFPEAIASAQATHDLAVRLGRQDAANTARVRLELYQSGRPYHQPW